MVFDDDEVVALVAGLRMVAQSPAPEVAARALVKLCQALPRRLSGLAADVAARSETVMLEEAQPCVALGPVAIAAAADLTISFSYIDNQGRTSRRRVDSLRCLLVRARWYVLGYDTERNNWRVFRLDRIRAVISDQPTRQRNPPSDDLATWLRTDFGRARSVT